MNTNIAILAGMLVLLGLAAPASADPTGCLGGGYNPTALSNVCLGSSGPGQPIYTGTVGTTPGPCVIGQTCVPIPTYDPNGGTPLPVSAPAVPTLTYADANAGGFIVQYDNGQLTLNGYAGYAPAHVNCYGTGCEVGSTSVHGTAYVDTQGCWSVRQEFITTTGLPVPAEGCL